MAMPPWVQSTNNYDASQGIKALIYGPSAVGKTRSIATLPNPIIFSHESGLLSLRHHNLPYIKIGSMEELIYYSQWVRFSPEGQSFHSIAFDSLSEIAEVCLIEREKTTKDGRMTYREMGKDIKELIRVFRDLPGKNVVFTAKQEWTKDEVTGMMNHVPSMPGRALTIDLPYMFDMVFQGCRFPVKDGADQFAFRTKSDLSNFAKDRSGALSEWEHPDFGAILAKLQQRN